ncbi:hypothetical protein JP0474_02040 [Helicobacter pylori]|nr:hypothetical protein HPOKI154_01975 [Helicobacter pylori oki154]AHN41645.1 hypothetical protein HPOKI673_01965 [Helicobacter pylori oki673]AHN43082.1 hypothetical protein HPOKI828_01960 [Helicobacter pylori oki828]GHS60490.1 hypothetical protein JP0521_00780 [Helicobacter pylori]
MPDIRNLYLPLPSLTERLCKINRRLYIMLSSYSFLAREHCILERMHEIIQKGMDGLTQRLDNDLKDEHSRILVPIGYIKGLCCVGGMKPDDLCVLFVKIFELIRSRFKSNLSRNSLSFMGGVISGLNKQICMDKKLK